MEFGQLTSIVVLPMRPPVEHTVGDVETEEVVDPSSTVDEADVTLLIGGREVESVA